MPALETHTYTPDTLFAGDYPVQTDRGIALADTTALTPVLRDAAGKWKIAGATDKATGLMMSDVLAGKACQVYTSGCFDIAIINFDAALTTKIKQKAHFTAPLFVKPLNAL